MAAYYIRRFSFTVLFHVTRNFATKFELNAYSLNGNPANKFSCGYCRMTLILLDFVSFSAGRMASDRCWKAPQLEAIHLYFFHHIWLHLERNFIHRCSRIWKVTCPLMRHVLKILQTESEWGAERAASRKSIIQLNELKLPPHNNSKCNQYNSECFNKVKEFMIVPSCR